MIKDEALKLALEALHGFIPYLPLNDEAQCGRYDKAITAIKEALAQPEQEPVAWRYKILDYFGRPVWTFKTPKTDIRVFESQPLYTSPPQHTWVGLTDEEFRAILRSLSRQQGWDGDGWDLALKEAIEAAHGIKELV